MKQTPSPAMLEQLARLRDAYLRQLPEKLAAIEEGARVQPGGTWTLEQVRHLHQHAHKLAGSAGTFGLPDVSDAARHLERALVAHLGGDSAPDARTQERLAEQVETLRRAMASALAGERADAGNHSTSFSLSPGNRGNLLYVVEDDAQLARLISARLSHAGYEVRVFGDVAEFLAVCRASAPGGERPAAVIMDIILPEGSDAGIEAVANMKRRCNGQLPVVFISVRDDMETRLKALRLGATRYLTKPLDLDRLARLMDDVTLRLPVVPYRVLLVDDDVELLAHYQLLLEGSGMQVRAVSDPLAALAAVDEFRPDVMVFDVYMPGCTGLELAAILREGERFAQVPIIFLSVESDIKKQLLALDLGGDDFVTKPIDPAHLVAAVMARAKRSRYLQQVSDDLRHSLRESTLRQTALDQHAIVSIADAAGRIVYANSKFTEISGYSLAELLGQNHRLLKSGVHPDSLYEELWATISGGAVWKGEICNRRKDGSFYWAESTIVPFLDANGLPYQYISVRTDITAIMQAERELAEREERLRRSQIYANIGTWDWNIQTGALFWSDRIGPLFGYPDGKLDTTYENFLNAVYPDDRQRVIDAVSACVERGVSYNIEHRCVWPDGTVRWLLESGDVTRDEAGKPLHMLGVVQDITRRKLAEERMVAARDEADRANRAKSEFLSSMSHELRTPMNAILGFAQLLEVDAALTADQRDSIAEILGAGRHLLELINEVLDLSRIEAGRVDLSIEPVDCQSLVAECLGIVRPVADARRISLASTGCADLVLRADRVRLKQALLNLLSNAVKYNRPGGEVRLTSCLIGGDRLQLRVTDTGAGIPEGRIKDLFLPFNRLGAEQSGVEGTGIGLVISRRLVEMMGGSIGVESRAGEGSTFWIELPLGEKSDLILTPGRRTHAAGAAVSAARTVLYIEDNPANLKLVSQMLARRPNLRMLSAHTPVLGLDLADANRPDLVLLDINMPDLNGYEVLLKLRAFDWARELPVIAITANAMPGDIERGLAAGFDDYLTKPLDLDRFLAAIDRFLSRPAPADGGPAP